MRPDLQKASDRFESWVCEQALPLWSTVGFNSANGSSYEALLANGSPNFHINSRVLVQARQVYVFAMADHLGWFSKGKVFAEKIVEFINSVALHPSADCGYVHLLNPQNEPIDITQNLYDHCFLVLAFTWFYRAFGSLAALEKAVELVEYIDSKFAAPYGGWKEALNDAGKIRRQNPHMHMFEVFLNLYEVSGDGRWLSRAGEIFALFENRFFCHSDEVIYENFAADWSLLKDAKGKQVEPGHMMEWVWLLRWYERCSKRPVSRYANVLYAKALELGLSPYGLLFDEVDADGAVHKESKRCWPMTEYIKASIAQARVGFTECEENAVSAINNLFEFYISKTMPGMYIDQLGDVNQVIVDAAPASTMYHLILAASEVSGYCKA